MAPRSRGATPVPSVGPAPDLAAAEGESPDRIFIATLRINIPRGIWTFGFTNAHPNVHIEVLNRGEVDASTSISDHWISGRPPGVWAKEIARFPDVLQVESLAQVGEGCLYRITYRNPPILGLYRRLRLPIPFPLRMQGGTIDWEIVARYADFSEILQYARQRDPRAKVISIKRRPLRNHLPALTERQHELFTVAMASGYFAVPRGITLTDLARKVSRSKSSVSESIALIEKKLLETAMRPPLASA